MDREAGITVEEPARPHASDQESQGEPEGERDTSAVTTPEQDAMISRRVARLIGEAPS
jgi:hypothetical protein